IQEGRSLFCGDYELFRLKSFTKYISLQVRRSIKKIGIFDYTHFVRIFTENTVRTRTENRRLERITGTLAIPVPQKQKNRKLSFGAALTFRYLCRK
ncbi:hypothetical protein, partial [Alistipes putredinis]|uniref:hypothetical protein n=1 Tax=Alistipes putredinis TaxID=28117 RepID=UPI003FD726CD